MGYRVELEIYNGPLDLLLYLIRKDEVDIYDIPISRITDQYLTHVEVLKHLDPDSAGDFLALAATLMEIKSRTLLPQPELEQEDEELIDPRSQLVRQLLEYKKFKDAAALLAEAADERSLKFARVPVLPQVNGDQIDLEDLQIWDLVEAFGQLLAATLSGPGLHRVEYDDTPIGLYQTNILDRLEREQAMPFSQIFQGRTNRGELIGLFLALLELIRQGLVGVEQDKVFEEIYVFLRVELPAEPNQEPPNDTQ